MTDTSAKAAGSSKPSLEMLIDQQPVEVNGLAFTVPRMVATEIAWLRSELEKAESRSDETNDIQWKAGLPYANGVLMTYDELASRIRPATASVADPYKAICEGGTGGKCCDPDCEKCWPDPPPSETDAAAVDRAYCEGAQQALAIAHQSIMAADKWLAEGCGNRRSMLHALNGDER